MIRIALFGLLVAAALATAGFLVWYVHYEEHGSVIFESSLEGTVLGSVSVAVREVPLSGNLLDLVVGSREFTYLLELRQGSQRLAQTSFYSDSFRARREHIHVEQPDAATIDLHLDFTGPHTCVLNGRKGPKWE